MRRRALQRVARLRLAAHLALAMLFLTHQSAWAAVITVDGFDSTVAYDGDCSLREAITAANTDTASGATPGECPAGAGADTVTLTGDASLTLADNSTDGSNGLPSATSDITVVGDGHTVARRSAGGTPEFRLSHVTASGTLTLGDVTVSNGNVTSGGLYETFGSGLYNRGSTILTNSTVSGNLTILWGGAIDNACLGSSGTVTMANSIVAN